MEQYEVTWTLECIHLKVAKQSHVVQINLHREERAVCSGGDREQPDTRRAHLLKGINPIFSISG